MTEPPYEKLIKQQKRIFLAFTTLALLTPIIVITIPWLPEKENLAHWFQRSGSLVVILTLIAESSAIAIYNILNPSGFVGNSFEEVSKQYESLPKNYTKISLLLIGIGTFI